MSVATLLVGWLIVSMLANVCAVSLAQTMSVAKAILGEAVLVTETVRC